jgi:ketosteroid isomerase-like protein
LPELYNNLAVLYAAQGQYDKARHALEMSIRTHPSYATAYENLGDVYAKLASQAYDKALQLDSSNSGAKSKLSMVRELISGGPRSGAAAPASTAAASAARPTVVAAAPKAETAPPTPAPAKAAPAAKAAAAPAEAASKGGSDEVLKTVRAWAIAWSQKDADAYLAHYAKDFRTPGGESLADWAKGRRQRISAPKKIEVGVESPKVAVAGDTATVTFRQHYRSDSLKVSSVKTLVLAQSGGKWLIRQERTGN